MHYLQPNGQLHFSHRFSNGSHNRNIDRLRCRSWVERQGTLLGSPPKETAREFSPQAPSLSLRKLPRDGSLRCPLDVSATYSSTAKLLEKPTTISSLPGADNLLGSGAANFGVDLGGL